MTCIIGMLDKKNDCVWIGGDSLGSNGFTKAVEAQPKIFRNKVFKNVVMGSTSTFRHIDLLKYSDTLFNEADFYKGTILDHEYMVTKFIPNIIKLFKDGMVCMDETDRGANFIVGAKNKLFEIQCDYSVLEPERGFTAVGRGEYAANASMFTTEGMKISIPDRIKLALNAAESCCCGVQRPFRIMNTKDEEVIVIE
jgi:ATP-dependent protease HslVU (ClpYQ) peptidase subunit